MCLAVPGKILSIEKAAKRAEVDFGGVTRAVQLDLLAGGARVGEYVVVHAGYAIQKLSKKDAAETVRLLNEVYGRLPV